MGSTTPAGEAFVDSFSNMTRSMMAQSRSLSRKVSLAQLVDDSGSSVHHIETNKGNERGSSDSGNLSGRGFAREKVLKDLRSLETIVSALERRAASAREAIDCERRACAEMNELCAAANERAKDLLALYAALPQHLPCAEPPQPRSPQQPTTATAHASTAMKVDSNSTDNTSAPPRCPQTAVPTRGTNRETNTVCRTTTSTAIASMVPTLELVTVAELEAVPRSTRARLTIAQVNSAVTEIQKAMEKRQALLSKPRAKLSEKQRRRYQELQQQAMPAHGGEPFIAEADLRALPSFKKGEVTSKALIATLRSLKRIRGVRGPGIMTYAIQGT